MDVLLITVAPGDAVLQWQQDQKAEDNQQHRSDESEEIRRAFPVVILGTPRHAYLTGWTGNRS